MWSEWETMVLERRGPERTRGVLVYLQGVPSEVPEVAISLPIQEIARVASFDVLRLGWREDANDRHDALVRFAATEIAKARRQGYARIVLVGEGLRGSLAIAVAALADVDGLMALGPVGRPTDNLAQLLSASRAKHVAIVLFQGDDPPDDERRGRATALRQALQSRDRTSMLIDRPEDIDGEQGRAPGRFTRRYRDCLAGIVAGVGLTVGEVSCDPHKGFAIGGAIGFDRPPSSFPRPLRSADEAGLEFFLGHWQGDDARGAYVTLTPVEARLGRIVFRHRYAPRPGGWISASSTYDALFILEGGTMTSQFENAAGLLRKRGPAELEYLLTYNDGHPQQKFLLRLHSLSTSVPPPRDIIITPR